MPFAYYARLSPEERAIYRASDGITSLRLAGAQALTPWIDDLQSSLAREDRGAAERAASRLVSGLCSRFAIRAPRVEVLEVRPTFTAGELHGLYTSLPGGRATIQVWMRTAHYARVVAFKTFLRTLLHEIGHHLDMRVLRLPMSFHTEGFFKRESSLFHQLVPAARRARVPPSGKAQRRPDR